MLEQSVALHARDRTGLWHITKTDDTFVGFVALWPFHDPPVTELVFALGERYWHQGHAREAAITMIGYARDVLGWRTIEATADTPNVESHRLLQRLGFSTFAEVPGAFGTQQRYRLALDP